MALTLALLVLTGPGSLTDAVIKAALERVQLAGKPAFSLTVCRGSSSLAQVQRTRLAARLAAARVRVTLIDRHNYHLFQPFQVATARLSPGDVATPIRGLFREHFNTDVLLGEVTGGTPGSARS